MAYSSLRIALPFVHCFYQPSFVWRLAYGYKDETASTWQDLKIASVLQCLSVSIIKRTHLGGIISAYDDHFSALHYLPVTPLTSATTSPSQAYDASSDAA